MSEQLGQDIRLPSEPEWERAARGTQGRLYPWGNEATEEEISARCNWAKTGLGTTSVVGLFPLGDARIQENEKSSLVSDLAGNVWEWTRSLWGEKWDEAEFGYPYDADDGREKPAAPVELLRVLRGASWNFNSDYLLSSNRVHLTPDDRNINVGFRCVLVGLSSP